jgi:hypothetical protein
MSLSLVTSEYSGHRISFSEGAWFNATEAAAYFGRRVDFWIKTKETKEYIEALCRHLNTSKRRDLIRTKRGRNGGTWMHPRLAVPFARWCSPDFGVWCDLQIDQIIRGTHPHYNWKRMRCESTSSNKVMAEALRIVREESGKSTLAHHYSNECRLINWALTGDFTSLDRDSLSDIDLIMLSKLEMRNTVLVSKNLDYQTRKAALRVFAMDNHQLLLSSINKPVEEVFPETKEAA